MWYHRLSRSYEKFDETGVALSGGKITTPEYVVDKSTKLEKVYDRILDVKTRFELLKREYQLAMLEAKNNKADRSP